MGFTEIEACDSESIVGLCQVIGMLFRDNITFGYVGKYQ